MIREEDLVVIGRFAGPHGVKGEITLVTSYDGLFEEADDPYIVCDMDGIFVPFYIESFRPKGSSALLVKLDDVDDEVSAKRFTNKAVYYPSGILSEWEHDDRSWNRFIGYTIVDKVSGREIGTVTAVDESTANVLLRVDDNGRERLIPIVLGMIDSVDEQRRRMELSLPEGILDLN